MQVSQNNLSKMNLDQLTHHIVRAMKDEGLSEWQTKEVDTDGIDYKKYLLTIKLTEVL